MESGLPTRGSVMKTFNGDPVGLRIGAVAEYEKCLKYNAETALEFKAKWEKCLAELQEAEVTYQPETLFIEYLKKVGPKNSEDIRLDS